MMERLSAKLIARAPASFFTASLAPFFPSALFVVPLEFDSTFMQELTLTSRNYSTDFKIFRSTGFYFIRII